MNFKDYLLSLLERVVRASVGLGARTVREVGEVAVPRGIRRTQLHQNLIDANLRYLIEQIGDVGEVYQSEEHLAEEFLPSTDCGQCDRTGGYRCVSRIARVGAGCAF